MKKYTAEMSNLISYPMGGIGAGMICLQGPGNLGNISIWHKPNLDKQPIIFSAITILGRKTYQK